MIKEFPLTKAKIDEVITKHVTPFHIYDEQGIIKTHENLCNAFSWAHSFKNYYAIKALPNPYIVKSLAKVGSGADCSSLPELIIAYKAGIKGEDIFMTSNNTTDEEFIKASELGAIINLDDISHIDDIQRLGIKPEVISLRYNPGHSRVQGINDIIGDPIEAKYGHTKEQIFEAYKRLKEYGIKRFILHAMIVSNETDEKYHIDTARDLFKMVKEIHDKLEIKIERVNLGGGLGIPYKDSEKEMDLNILSRGVKKYYDEVIRANNLEPIAISTESGRYITGPYGWLVTKAIHHKDTYKNYIGVDATMSDLMRPGIYGAYHKITVLGKENQKHDHKYDITGSLCENNDKFAIDRYLPKIQRGDILIIHSTGAHGHAMGFNYNGKLRHAELVLRTNKSIQQIRRAENIDDYFRTLDFDGLDRF